MSDPATWPLWLRLPLLTLGLVGWYAMARWQGYRHGFRAGRTGVEGDDSLRRRCRAVFDRHRPGWTVEEAKGEHLDAIAEQLFNVKRRRPAASGPAGDERRGKT